LTTFSLFHSAAINCNIELDEASIEYII